MEQTFNTSEIMLRHHHEFCKKYGYKVEHFLCRRLKPYNPSGRHQTEEQARDIDQEIVELLDSKGISYITVAEDPVEEILNHLKIK